MHLPFTLHYLRWDHIFCVTMSIMSFLRCASTFCVTMSIMSFLRCVSTSIRCAQGRAKKFSRKQKFFRKTTFAKEKKPSFLKNFAIPACQGPLPASWAPFFTFLGGVTPPTPPGGTALVARSNFKKNMPVSQNTSPSKTQYLDREMTEIPQFTWVPPN